MSDIVYFIPLQINLHFKPNCGSYSIYILNLTYKHLFFITHAMCSNCYYCHASIKILEAFSLVFYTQYSSGLMFSGGPMSRFTQTQQHQQRSFRLRWLSVLVAALLILSTSATCAQCTTVEQDLHIVHNVDNRSM